MHRETPPLSPSCFQVLQEAQLLLPNLERMCTPLSPTLAPMGREAESPMMSRGKATPSDPRPPPPHLPPPGNPR